LYTIAKKCRYTRTTGARIFAKPRIFTEFEYIPISKDLTTTYGSCKYKVMLFGITMIMVSPPSGDY
jgi:hypothetical protein